MLHPGYVLAESVFSSDDIGPAQHSSGNTVATRAKVEEPLSICILPGEVVNSLVGHQCPNL